MEIWKNIPGFKKRYEVSNLGVVRSHQKVLKPKTDADGYLRLGLLLENGIRSTCRVHRIVAFAHIANPENKPLINHKDGNRKNNVVDNLEWATHAENIGHALDAGKLRCHGKVSKRQLPKVRIRKSNGVAEETKVDIRALRAKGVKIIDIARLYRISPSYASEISNGIK